ncbi:MAG: hypothetical protein RMJ57_09155, partial [Bacteroidia bacterium]|nr:hypothetical protein [Bacteroidia bacterium]
VKLQSHISTPRQFRKASFSPEDAGVGEGLTFSQLSVREIESSRKVLKIPLPAERHTLATERSEFIVRRGSRTPPASPPSSRKRGEDQPSPL